MQFVIQLLVFSVIDAFIVAFLKLLDYKKDYFNYHAVQLISSIFLFLIVMVVVIR